MFFFVTFGKVWALIWAQDTGWIVQVVILTI